MRHNLELIYYTGKFNPPHRQRWELPAVTPEEFDPKIHNGKVFQYPFDGDFTDNTIYIFKYCVPENKEEQQKLIDLGKWGTVTPKIPPIPE